jgi:hypothetical protein
VEERSHLKSKRLQRIQESGDPRGQQRYAAEDIAVEFPIDAAVVDVSESGMGIESGQQLRVGADYVFRVQMGDQSFGLPGKVEWCRFAGTKAADGAERAVVYKAGVSFAHGPAQEAWCEALAGLISSGIQPVAAATHA